MPTYEQYQRGFVAALLGRSRSTPLVAAAGSSGLAGLVDALPAYGSPGIEAAHRATLGMLLQLNLPDDPVVGEPSSGGVGFTTVYLYDGPYSGYADAFFPGRAATAATTDATASAHAAVPALDPAWWQRYAVAVLTDAARQTTIIPLDTGKLAADLSSFTADLRPTLSACYLATLRSGYPPTAAALSAVASQQARVRAELTTALSDGQFTATLDQARAAGGDGASAAGWFLYNLWILLTALGSADVDADIRTAQAAGLPVPVEVGPGSWWNGGYTAWSTPLSGTDVAAATAGRLTEDLPEIMSTTNPPAGFPAQVSMSAAQGYGWSLCTWGPLGYYPPQVSSCLGAGTGVLMADGTVRAIEDVGVGDAVRSGRGPGTVVLAERPRRGGRSLYALDGLDVRATAGHPFRAAGEVGPRRRAVDPWCLIDAVPTMTAAGVGALVPGAALAGLDARGTREVLVAGVTSHDAGEDVDEPVYDLVVDDGDRGHAVYFVGGPERFVAVDAESADPWHDVPTSVGVVAAMDAALEAVREHAPPTGVPALVACLPMSPAAGPVPGADSTRARIPGPELTMRDGDWDPHAAALEVELVRRFGRALRRAATGWRSADAGAGPGFTVCVHDLELLGDVALAGEVVLELRLRGPAWPGDLVRTVPLGGPSWHLTPDVEVDLDPSALDASPGSAGLLGVLRSGGRTVGHVRAVVAPGLTEHVVFDPDAAVVGRIAIDQRRVDPAERAAERDRAHRWTRRDARAVAVGAGQGIGAALARAATERTGRWRAPEQRG